MLSVFAFGQAPAYYNDVNLNLNGQDLKGELAVKIISTHTTFLGYTPGVWDALKQSDLDPNDPNKVLLIYGYDDNDGVFKTDRTRNKDDHGSGIGIWNREHVYPKSLGNPNLGTTGPGSDAHHLRPCDGQMNSSRSNRKFADGSGNSVITPQGHWYPGDEWKGDVARMMMYMYLRYDAVCLPSNVGIGNAVAGDTNMIDLFLQWNVDDPVNGFEDNRNNVLGGIQGNRNPFIDNPAFATQIWGGPQAEDRFGSGGSDTEAPSIPANLIASNTTTTATMLAWSASTDNIGVTGYDVYQNSVLIANVTTTTYNVSGLTADSSYSFHVVAKDQAGNASGNSNIASVTTLPNGGGANASDLFISEYIEGSSNNKALEIANFTGASVDLSAYSLKKATNGSGSFSSTVALSGQLANGQVYVVANSSASSTILNEADATNGGVLTFNGNDAVALYKNNVLIDLLGDANSSANYAQNVTLQRKSSVINPNTSYAVSEWDTFATDTFTGLGSHSIDGGGTSDTTAPTVPVNVVASNVTQTTLDLTWDSSTDDVAVTGYDVYQGTNLLVSVLTTNYSVSGLTADTDYGFSVRAKDAAGNISTSSSSVNVTTLPIPDTEAPSAPANLTASNVTQTALDLSWNASTDNVAVIGYDVSQDGTVIASVTSTNYVANGLTAETAYNFSITAKDEAGNISSANSLNVTTESAPTSSSTVLSESYFESGWDGWTDGGSDCYRYSGSRSYEGNRSIRLRDNSGTGSAMTSSSYDLSGYDSVEVLFFFYSYSMENNEDFWLRYFNGSTWVTVGTWARGTDFSNNNFYTATVTLDSSNYNFANNAQFRFQADASGNNDHIYIDQVVITGITGGSPARSTVEENPSTIAFVSHLNTDEFAVFEEDFKMYPNPVAGNILNIQLANDAAENVKYRIVSILGQVIAKGQLTEDFIQVDRLPSGMYILEINDGEEVMTRKFIKK